MYYTVRMCRPKYIHDCAFVQDSHVNNIQRKLFILVRIYCVYIPQREHKISPCYHAGVLVVRVGLCIYIHDRGTYVRICRDRINQVHADYKQIPLPNSTYIHMHKYIRIRTVCTGQATPTHIQTYLRT